MSIPLLIGVVLCAGLLITTRVREKRNKEKKDEGINKLSQGVKIRTLNGMVGVITEVTGNGSFKVDMSPDQTGSVVEITKDAFYKIEE